MNLRERKKLKTRQHIADTAARLFIERGFDAVTVDEVAQAAEVSKKTVFNYFPTKEDLVLHHANKREELLVALVRDRAPGVSLAEAFRDQALDVLHQLAARPPGYGRGGLMQVIRSSPTLVRRVHELHAHQAQAVATELALLTDAPESDPLPLIVAHTLLGAHRALFHECHRRLAANESPAEAARALEPHVHRIYELLEHGLAGYARTTARTGELSEHLTCTPTDDLTDHLTHALTAHAG